jgi:magnesium chelatase family protein
VLATIPSASLLGADGHAVTVEVHASGGLPAFTVVGLPDASCREARDRVRAALMSSQLEFPLKKVTVNLAPSTIRKVGSSLDLAIAVGVLVASGQVPPESVEGFGFIGELGLDGTIRPVAGTVCLAGAVTTPVIVAPQRGAEEAALVAERDVRGVHPLPDLAPRLWGPDAWPPPVTPAAGIDPPRCPDLAEVRGQPVARLALEVAAAGGHHLLMLGPPGAGKTMLASRLPGLLPPLDDGDALEVTRVHSAAGVTLPPGGLVRRPPFRAPHHGASMVALVGGGTASMRPGEISLADHGVLFLDELAEFAPHALDAMRQPLEEGVIRVARAAASVSFPARFLLVAATNPCPCGEGGPPGGCRCSDAARLRYQRRLSGPLLDRFDLRIEVPRPDVDDLLHGEPGEPSAPVAERVATARSIAAARGVRANAELPVKLLDEVAPVDDAASELLEVALRAGRLSGRGLHRVRRVARTIADLRGCTGPLRADHVALALQLRVELLGGSAALPAMAVGS